MNIRPSDVQMDGCVIVGMDGPTSAFYRTSSFLGCWLFSSDTIEVMRKKTISRNVRRQLSTDYIEKIYKRMPRRMQAVIDDQEESAKD